MSICRVIEICSNGDRPWHHGVAVSHASVRPVLKKGMYRLEDEVASSIWVGKIFKIPVHEVGVGATCCNSSPGTVSDIQRDLRGR